MLNTPGSPSWGPWQFSHWMFAICADAGNSSSIRVQLSPGLFNSPESRNAW